ncbi:hypothetical protein EJ04DRAFT_516397 [Polyplosphaeria fusca]|uniref:DNA-directed RNA polymerase subunit n=1 Tax=Polyplosphaeria fusca TaxID=682080 RepID=A0A9P4QK09_9PLEO|nr:hypothetical protein EJ04DRAFT_516397 [Polyplosphaeria fusca]
MAPIENAQPSLFHIERISQYVALTPASLATPLPSICASIFSPLLLSYFAPARGIVLAYQNTELSDSPPASRRTLPRPSRREEREEDAEEGTELLCNIIDEYSAAFLWATADLLVWRPEKHVWIEGRITHQAMSHISLSYLNAFSMSIMRQHLPEGWTWHQPHNKNRQTNGDEASVGTEGFWCDAGGMPVDGVLKARIRDWGFGSSGKGKSFVKVEGSLVSEDAEKAKENAGKGNERKKAKGVLRRTEQNGERAGEAMDVD